MKYIAFHIENYRAIKKPITINLKKHSLIPIVGVNECGKTTILQAINSFDYVNDHSYDGAHLSNLANLYETSSPDPLVTAEIELKHGLLQGFYDNIRTSLLSTDEKTGEEPDEEISDFEIDRKTFENKITIIRNIRTRKYQIPLFSGESEAFQDKLGRRIVLRAPYILYNDDFQDRPPSRLDIPLEKHQSPDAWLAIFETLFKQTNSDFSLYTLAGLDPRTLRSVLSDVEVKLNTTLTGAWKSFVLDSKDKKIKISLDYESPGDEKPGNLAISVIEETKGKERFFNVDDRSKGFLWFYNFVMKLEFNPKVIGEKENTIHLLDEPGCYLHATAQEKLCDKLSTISKKDGVVIYCTHSHKLLNPKVIPVNQIKIVSKTPSKTIDVCSMSTFRTTTKKAILSIQPILEALDISLNEFYVSDKPFIAVEGIYDKLAIDVFMKDSNLYRILPGTNANSVVHNVSYMIAFSIDYCCVWDNDNEGRKEYSRAENKFGLEEAKRYGFLPERKESKDRKMEQMFCDEDFAMIKDEFNLELDATYETMMSACFYSSKAVKTRISKKISKETAENFDVLSSLVSGLVGR